MQELNELRNLFVNMVDFEELISELEEMDGVSLIVNHMEDPRDAVHWGIFLSKNDIEGWFDFSDDGIDYRVFISSSKKFKDALS